MSIISNIKDKICLKPIESTVKDKTKTELEELAKSI